MNMHADRLWSIKYFFGVSEELTEKNLHAIKNTSSGKKIIVLCGKNEQPRH